MGMSNDVVAGDFYMIISLVDMVATRYAQVIKCSVTPCNLKIEYFVLVQFFLSLIQFNS